jgi:urease accessory protein
MPTPTLLWQLADSAFPAGGFSHSAGLEAAVQLGEVRSPDDLGRWLEQLLWSAGAAALPFAGAAHREPAALPEIDARCDAFLTGHVANRASRAQGRAFLRASSQALGGEAASLEALVRERGFPGHLAPVLGAVLAGQGIDRREAQRLLLFLSLRGAVSAAVRLGVIGPLEAQRLQARAAPTLEAVLAARGDTALEDAAQVAPLLDLLQGHQDRLYSRLFQS